MRTPPGVRVFASTAVELLARLYAHAHIVQGDFEPPPAPLGPAIALTEHDESITWFFGDDIALGMNLAVLAAERGWTDVATLLAGLRSSPVPRIVRGLLRPPSATAPELRRRDHLIARICDGRADPAHFAADGFNPESVARLLADPDGAVASLITLLEAAAGRFAGDEESVAAERIAARIGNVTKQLDGPEPLAVALAHATGGWTLRDPERYAITLVPSESLRPYVVARTVTDERAVVIFGGTVAPSRSTAELAEALKILGNVQRLAILANIANLPATGQDLAELLGLTEATIHHHTSALRGAGLITSEREGVRVYHLAAKEEITELLADVGRAIFGA